MYVCVCVCVCVCVGRCHGLLGYSTETTSFLACCVPIGSWQTANALRFRQCLYVPIMHAFCSPVTSLATSRGTQVNVQLRMGIRGSCWCSNPSTVRLDIPEYMATVASFSTVQTADTASSHCYRGSVSINRPQYLISMHGYPKPGGGLVANGILASVTTVLFGRPEPCRFSSQTLVCYRTEQQHVSTMDLL